MLFALGFIAGVVVCVFIAAVIILIQKPLYQITVPLIKKLEVAGPRARGFISEPISDADEVRAARIAENAEQGKDTPISELM